MEKIQWHQAFYASMRLELGDIDGLEFIEEYNLTEKPLEVDMIVIRKLKDVVIDNQIGEFFKGNNLIEYKSPADHSYNKYSLNQILSYGNYYCYKNQTDDTTLTMIVSNSHFNIIKWLRSIGINCVCRYNGIYTVCGVSMLDMQIVVVEEIDKSKLLWIPYLNDNLTRDNALEIINRYDDINEDNKKKLMDAVFSILVPANSIIFDKLKGDYTMTMLEFMKPEVDSIVESTVEKKLDSMLMVAKMVKHGDSTEYIHDITGISSERIDEMREAISG